MHSGFFFSFYTLSRSFWNCGCKTNVLIPVLIVVIVHSNESVFSYNNMGLVCHLNGKALLSSSHENISGLKLYCNSAEVT